MKALLRSRLTVPALLLVAAPSSAQVPSRLEAVEVARSRDCVPVLGRLDELDLSLAPLATRSQRLIAVAQAIALEDDLVLEQLDPTDPVEAAVRDWFAADAALAQRYVAQPSAELESERNAGRDAIRATVAGALEAVRARADSTIAATGNLQQQAARCSGAVLVRPVVLERCGTATSPVCAAARDTMATPGPNRFVGDAASIWDVQELRAWTTPGPLSVNAAGQLGGARTVGNTRLGNVLVSVAFTPLLQERSELSAEATTRFGALTDSLGFGNAHPDVVFVPALAVRAALPEALDEETSYLLHFGLPEDADVVWETPAGTGSTIEATLPLAPSHIARLQAGHPLLLTAIREADDGELEALYAIELTSLGQGQSVSALLGYMAGRLASDLTRLIPPDNS